MDQEKQIRDIQEELKSLQEQVVTQYHRIQALQKQLQLMDPSYVPVVASKSKSSKWKWENFIGLRLIHLAGIIVLVIGLSIGVKYAIDKELISEVARIGLAYGAGIVLYLLSVRLRKNYSLFSAILFSGGMASVYFTTYAAVAYYNMMPPAVAFMLMMLFTMYTTLQAISYNRQEIALLGLAGAYGIPFLISQNADRVDLFFLYIFIINSGISYLHIRLKWRAVGNVAMLLTWILFLGWSAVRFTPPQQGTGILFGGLFFLLFSGMILSPLFFRKHAFRREDAYAQLANNLAFYIAALFIAGNGGDDSLAMVTGCFALTTAIQAGLYHRYVSGEEAFFRVHLVASFLLAIIYVLLEWDGITVTFIWMLMAVLVFIWGAWQKMVVLRLLSMALMGFTLLKLVVWDSATFTPVQKVLAYVSLGILLLLTSFFYQKFRQSLFAEKDPSQD